MVEISRLGMVLLVLIVGLLVISNGVDGRTRVGEETVEDEIDRKLKLLNKPAVKTIHSKDGDIIDCVDIYKQPVFDHPALKNHKIQLKPSFATKDTTHRNNGSNNSTVTTSQTWHKSGTCPQGTIPIRRIRRQDLLRLASLEQLGKKTAASTNGKAPRYVTFDNGTRSYIGEYANRSSATLVTVGYNYLGAKANLNVWNPVVESNDEFTTAQIWLKAGPGDKFESVESGWMVNPKLYGDRRSRFFGYWTVDAYKSTGCFDLTCPGFVQTGTNVALGAAISSISSSGGDQYAIEIEMKQDPATRNWWLRFGGGEVGYWPPTLFGSLSHSSILVEWGGEVQSSKIMESRPHTGTAMGSGDFASGLMGAACYVMYPRIMDNSLEWKYPDWVNVASNEPYCYSAFNFVESYVKEPVFYFGGPGSRWNRLCP